MKEKTSKRNNAITVSLPNSVLISFAFLIFIGIGLPASSYPSPEHITANFYTKEIKFASEVVGPEDFEVDLTSPGAPQLLVSSYDRRKKGHGGIYSIPFIDDSPGEAVLLVNTVNGCPLRPHGISLVKSDRDDITRLYVINHHKKVDEGGACLLPRSPKGNRLLHAVEVFRIEADGHEKLKHEESLTDELLTSPNDLVALGNGQIYLTNEIISRSIFVKMLEFFKLKRISNVVHYTGTMWRKVLKGPRYANGIAVRDDRLFVAATLDKTIYVYRRDPENGDIKEIVERIKVGSGVDNLLWGFKEHGVSDHHSLFVAAHPSRSKFMGHARDPNKRSPSEVYRIITARSPVDVVRIYSNDGSVISAASVAIVFRGDLYIGQVFNNGIFRVTRD
ncbi:MAG: hypothetical protein KAI96_00230 [Thermodesulfovibrionia bacterium]|nr:hypothetical protein [Thermodesulfovibrionia bacterium]